MEKYKEMYNLNTEDLKNIKDFITLYEEVEKKYREYYIKCDSIRKNVIYQNYKQDNLTIEENCKNIKKMLDEEINKIQDEYRKNLLKEQQRKIIEQYNEIKEYGIIEKIYNDMYYGNIQKYFKIEPEEEKETVIYKIKDKLQEKDYYFNKKSTITQIYIRLKYLYDFHNEYYINKKEIGIDFDFLKNNLKFYQIFKDAIKKYTKENKENIEDIINTLSKKEEKEYIQRIK